MACGEKADKGEHDMADCVKYVSRLQRCGTLSIWQGRLRVKAQPSTFML